MGANPWISRALTLGAAVALAASCARPTMDGTSPVAATPSPHVGTASFTPATSTAELGPVPLPDDLPTPPGQYVLSADARYGIPPLQITFMLTRDGWESWGPGAVTMDADVRREVGFGFANVTDLYADPCHWDRLGITQPQVGPTVDQLIAGLGKVPHVRANEPIDTTLGGVAGRYVELTIDPDQDFKTCDRGEFHIWVDSRGESRYYQGPGQIEQFWVLDAKGVRLVVEGSVFPEASPENRADLRQVLDSLRIEDRATKLSSESVESTTQLTSLGIPLGWPRRSGRQFRRPDALPTERQVRPHWRLESGSRGATAKPGS